MSGHCVFPALLLCIPEHMASSSQAFDHTCDHGHTGRTREPHMHSCLSSGTPNRCWENLLVSSDHEVRKKCFLSFNLRFSFRQQKKYGVQTCCRAAWQQLWPQDSVEMVKTLASDVISPLHIDWVSRPSASHGKGFQRTMQGDVFSRAPLRAEYRHIIWYLEETPWTIYVPRIQNWLIHDFSGKPCI